TACLSTIAAGFLRAKAARRNHQASSSPSPRVVKRKTGRQRLEKPEGCCGLKAIRLRKKIPPRNSPEESCPWLPIPKKASGWDWLAIWRAIAGGKQRQLLFRMINPCECGRFFHCPMLPCSASPPPD